MGGLCSRGEQMKRDLLASLSLVLLAVVGVGCTRPNPLFKWQAPCGGTDSGTPPEDSGTPPEDSGTPSQDLGAPQDLGTAKDHVATDVPSVDGPLACVTPVTNVGCSSGTEHTFEDGLGGWTIDSSGSSGGPATTTGLALNRQAAFVYCGCGSLGFSVDWSRADADGGDVVPSAVSGIQLALSSSSVSLLDKTLHARIWMDVPGAGAYAAFVTEASDGNSTKLGYVTLTNGSWVELAATGAPADVAKLRVLIVMAESTSGGGGQVSGQVYIDELGWK